MRYITEDQVRQFLPMRDAIGLMETAFRQLAAGESINQPRRRMMLPSGSALHYMAAGSPLYYGAKIYATSPKRGAHFMFLLYRSETAEALAIIEANALGQIRTGAVSGLATRLMAAEDARTLAVIGSGFQAETQVAAMLEVRGIERVRVWSRDKERREQFARACEAKFRVSVAASESAEDAVIGAEIVVTATNAGVPVFDAGWVAAGAHINAMGSNQPARRELPGEILRRAGVIAVDSREQAEMESGDLLMARQEGSWTGDRLVELQEIVTGRVAGRNRPEEITIFKSNGLAIEDVAAAGLVYERSA